jgi:hypothetical protein
MKRTLQNPPALDEDKNHKHLPRSILERRIIWNLLLHLAEHGFTPSRVFDGMEHVKVADAKAAMEVVFSVDDSFVLFGGPRKWVRIICGNGIDIISDYCIADKKFEEAMDKFDPEEYA